MKDIEIESSLIAVIVMLEDDFDVSNVLNPHLSKTTCDRIEIAHYFVKHI